MAVSPQGLEWSEQWSCGWRDYAAAVETAIHCESLEVAVASAASEARCETVQQALGWARRPHLHAHGSFSAAPVDHDALLYCFVYL